ncbi:MAG: hypothetical protein MPL62_05300 [Alphaproteobacteria bacterium]|nr:hypothetical protein [Alphaproteobacteria bacterium]
MTATATMTTNKPFSLIKGRTTVTMTTSQPPALVGGAFRLLKQSLKRAIPAAARGRRPQKNKWTTTAAPSLSPLMSALTEGAAK